MKFAICNEIFRGRKPEEVFAEAARFGYEGVEIAPFTLADSVGDVPVNERRRLRAAAADCGVEIAGLHWVLVKPEGLHMTHPDHAVRDRTAQYLCELVEFCADLGGARIVVGSPKQRSLLPGVSPEQGRQWAVATFEPAVSRASQRGVIICLEPLSPAETNFINTAAEAIDLVQRLPSPHFKIILDVKAMCSEARPVPEIIRDAWPHFAHFHANDPNLKGPGFGQVDYGPIAEALNHTGYDGWISVEVFDLEDGPEAIASMSIDYLHRVFRRVGEQKLGSIERNR